MSEGLLIAKYDNCLIKYSEYQENIHKELYCPFCDPPLRVTHNVKGFFMAWRDKGGHNCGRAREQTKYLDPDWKGRKLTEIARNQEGNLEVTIDINALVYPTRKNTEGVENNNDGSTKQKEQDIFPIYKDRVEVFRDVIRSVYHMKRIIEKNGQEVLKQLKFKFRTSDGILSINEVVLTLLNLNSDAVRKSRFVIFKVDKAILSNGVIYINSLSANGINFAAKLNYPYNKNPFKKLEGEYVIGYGKITYSENSKKYFLTLTNDFQIRKLKEDVGNEFFNEVEFEEYAYKAFVKPKENTEDIKNNNIVDKEKINVKEEISKPVQNISAKLGSQADHSHKNIPDKENIDKPVTNLDVNSGGMFAGVKKFFKNFIGK